MEVLFGNGISCYKTYQIVSIGFYLFVCLFTDYSLYHCCKILRIIIIFMRSFVAQDIEFVISIDIE